jgi:hypothetical protein
MAEDSPSPLGRYDAHVEPASAPESLHEIRLLGVPVKIFIAAREQHDALIREFAVMALGNDDDRSSDPPELRALVREFGVHYAAASARPGDELEGALQAGKTNVDLTLWAPPSAARGAAEFERLMSAADQVCEQGLMLTMPRPQVIRDFSAWWFSELRRQLEGLPPIAWTGPADVEGDSPQS